QYITARNFITNRDCNRSDGARHRRAYLLAVAFLSLAAWRLQRHLTAISHLHRARLAIEFEEHGASAILMHVTDGDEAHDQRLALLDLQRHFIARVQAIEEHRGGQHADAA